MVTASLGCAERRAPVSTADPDGPQPSSAATQIGTENAWGAFMIRLLPRSLGGDPCATGLRIGHVPGNVKSVQELSANGAMRLRGPLEATHPPHPRPPQRLSRGAQRFAVGARTGWRSSQLLALSA